MRSMTSSKPRVVQSTSPTRSSRRYTLLNFPHLRTLIQEKRTEFAAEHGPGARTVSMLTGDFLMPYLLSSLDRGRGMIGMLNATPIDYVTWGNHEADLAHADVLAREREYEGVWVNTNMPSHESVAASTCQTDVAWIDLGAKKSRHGRAPDAYLTQAGRVQRRDDRGPLADARRVQTAARGGRGRPGPPALPPLRRTRRAYGARVRPAPHPRRPRPPRRGPRDRRHASDKARHGLPPRPDRRHRLEDGRRDGDERRSADDQRRVRSRPRLGSRRGARGRGRLCVRNPRRDAAHAARGGAAVAAAAHVPRRSRTVVDDGHVLALGDPRRAERRRRRGLSRRRRLLPHQSRVVSARRQGVRRRRAHHAGRLAHGDPGQRLGPNLQRGGPRDQARRLRALDRREPRLDAVLRRGRRRRGGPRDPRRGRTARRGANLSSGVVRVARAD
mmetsp:Transcript_34474/g.105949  ORF Transcript_34474/g.105949 Transcript_34474/m.105949 type:complete len:444 (-) Transcript_34474:358-1689(-)